MFGPYVHNIDPIIGSIAGIHLWWYGLSYSLGFLNIYSFLRRKRAELGFSAQAVYTLALFVVVGVLVGGRFIQVVFYEWPFYRARPSLVPAYWIGGMATHGLLLGAVAAIFLFNRIYRKSFLVMTDALAVPAAFILGVGRLGNFIDGQIVGSITDMPWAVKFPDADGFRHPVVLYDGAKNLVLIPLLLSIGKRQPPQGVVTGVFLFLYAFLRIFIDFFREYPTTLLGLATGQSLNILMAFLGLLLFGCSMRRRGREAGRMPEGEISFREASKALWWRRTLFVALLLFALTLPSDWTQDIPARYGKRHAGLQYSSVYPRINAARAELK
ncbi:MAG: prolipoprotein diacylglyceryl transferase [Deltaproteobacteria bacterium]|nr:prolipoprotein diacylglyceryl transferase [Deltaproteobacteria bacterium]